MDRFLVVQLARFGDIVQTGRLIKTLAERGETHVCVDISLTKLAALLYPNVCVHGMAVHSKPDDSGLATNIEVQKELHALHFDRVYLLNHSPFSTALAKLFAHSEIYGHYEEDGYSRHDFITELGFRFVKHRRAAAINLVDFWAHLVQNPIAPEKVNPPATPGGGGVGIVLAGRESRRSLPAKVLAPLAATAFEACGGRRLVLLGSKQECAAAQRFMHELPPTLRSKTENLAGKTDWAELADVLQGLDTVLTPDTGTMHLAARLGVPVRAFFLSSAWCHETGPYGKGHHVWQTNSICAPCLESAPCTCGTTCLQAFSDARMLRSIALSLTTTDLHDEALPEGITRWVTETDTIGSFCRPGSGYDDRAAERHGYREIFAESIHVPYFSQSVSAATDAAGRIYTERDWMLPQQSRGQRSI